eukprot:TRINITY_DN1318_c0_g1_i16.p1 TRINITY_DN1318_c0_g1~~TRINITY_DN1318_c0_g1_i16.p1  ORF type:complete len:163 (+),score=38.70 TRINITY_DN1318_c0_g1_i16:67-555(+)
MSKKIVFICLLLIAGWAIALAANQSGSRAFAKVLTFNSRPQPPAPPTPQPPTTQPPTTQPPTTQPPPPPPTKAPLLPPPTTQPPTTQPPTTQPPTTQPPTTQPPTQPASGKSDTKPTTPTDPNTGVGDEHKHVCIGACGFDKAVVPSGATPQQDVFLESESS